MADRVPAWMPLLACAREMARSEEHSPHPDARQIHFPAGVKALATSGSVATTIMSTALCSRFVLR